MHVYTFKTTFIVYPGLKNGNHSPANKIYLTSDSTNKNHELVDGYVTEFLE